MFIYNSIKALTLPTTVPPITYVQHTDTLPNPTRHKCMVCTCPILHMYTLPDADGHVWLVCCRISAQMCDALRVICKLHFLLVQQFVPLQTCVAGGRTVLLLRKTILYFGSLCFELFKDAFFYHNLIVLLNGTTLVHPVPIGVPSSYHKRSEEMY